MKVLRRPNAWRVVGLAAMTSLFVAACSSAASPAHSAVGGTVTFGEAAASPPTYIFPMESGAYFTNQNLYQFSNQLYVPLFAFGDHGKAILNTQLSVADPPVFSDGNTVVTISLKHWQWSTGKPITARDVIFWMNLLSAATDPAVPAVGSSAAPGPGWGAAVPGSFPQNVVSYTQSGTYTFTLKLNGSYNPTWFTYNQLSQIYPLPQYVWDKLGASGPVGNYDMGAQARMLAPVADDLPANSYVPADPGSATTGALGVAQFLNTQSQDLGTYSTDPLWKVVDGPFRLSEFTTGGFVKMIPNANYSGYPKPTIGAFEEMPFTSDSAEFSALRNGALTIGYIPVQDLGERQSLERSGYSFSPWYGYGFAYLSYNYTNPTVGPIFRQLYFRQAVQSLVDQTQYIRDFSGGYGSVEVGPVPSYPTNSPFQSPLERGRPVYPFDPAKAVKLLSENGWKVVPTEVTYCQRPGSGSGQCGTGIRAHQALSFTLLYPSGNVESTNEMESLQSVAKARAGIAVSLKAAPYQEVTSIALNGCTSANPCSQWEIANWVDYWTYAPDYLPTGGELFATGAASNGGDYSSASNDANIAATHTAPDQAAEIQALYRYQNFLAEQVPVIYMPNAPLQLTAYRSDLTGLIPQNVFDAISPQFYRLGSH